MRNIEAKPERLLSILDVCERVSLSRGTLYEMTRAGAFPLPVQLYKRRVAWREKDVVAWIVARPTVEWRSMAQAAA